MSPLEAVATCREMREIGSPWPLPLLLWLDESAGQEAMFDFVISCVGDLLGHFGKTMEELKDAMVMARIAITGAIDHGLVEQTGWNLWNRRSEGGHLLAVARVILSLDDIHVCREDHQGFALNCALALKAFEHLETTPDEVLERVIAHFSRDRNNQPTITPAPDITRPSP